MSLSLQFGVSGWERVQVMTAKVEGSRVFEIETQWRNATGWRNEIGKEGPGRRRIRLPDRAVG